MVVHGAIDPAGQPAVVKAGVFRRFGRAMVLAAAALAAALLMSPTASAQLYTSTSGTEYWTSARWASGTSGPFTSNWVSGSNTNFATSGTYTFGRLASSGTATLGDITTGTGVFIGFNESGTSQGGNLNFGGDGGQVKTLDFGAGSVVDFGSIAIISGNGITKNGAGTLVLTGGAYTGGASTGFTLNAGNVIARSGTAFGTGNIVINGGAIGATQNTTLYQRNSGKTITVNGDFQLGTSGTFNGAATDGFNIAFIAARNGLNLNGGARTITLGSSGSMTFGQSITNGSLTLNRLASGSAGQFGLAAANSMSALTLDSVKVNALIANAALGAGTVTLQGADATTLNIQGGRTIQNAFTIADSAGTKTITGNNDTGNITGTITNSDSTGGLTIGSIGATNFTVGAIAGAGTTGVTFGSSTLLGTVTMSGVSSYAGDTRIDSSVLKMSGAGAVPNGKLVFQGASVAATFDLNGTTQTVAKLDDSALAGIIKSSAVGGQLVVGDSTDSTFAGTIISGASLGLEKIGSGKLTLTGANTYSGGTTVTAGTLLVNGSLANSAVTVGNGGTLGGSGSLGALLTVQSGGVLSPGNSPGVLAAAALDLEAGSTTFMEVIGDGVNAGVAGTNYDQIQITPSGGLKYGGGLNLNFGNSSQFLNGTFFDLFAFSGSPIGNFSTVATTGSGLYAGYNFSGSGGIWTSTIGDQLLTFSELTGRLTFSSSGGGAVPEIDPATGGSALSLVAVMLAMLEQRRRRPITRRRQRRSCPPRPGS
jgi:autotransporter-associated beta strand protein